MQQLKYVTKEEDTCRTTEKKKEYFYKRLITLNFNDSFLPKSHIILLTELKLTKVCELASFYRTVKNRELTVT